MKAALMGVLLAMILCVSASAQVQETDLPADIEMGPAPSLDVGDVLKEAGEWIIRNGEVGYFYDCLDDEGGSEAIAKLTLFDIADVVNVDAGATIPVENPDEVPSLLAGLSVSLSTVLEKFDVEWDFKFDVSAGVLLGYDFSDKDWMVGPTLAVKASF